MSTDSNRRNLQQQMTLFSCLFCGVALAMIIRLQMAPIDPLPADAGEDRFSAGRALQFLELTIANQQPHPVDSPSNRLIETHIVGRLQELGFDPQVQQETVCLDGQGTSRCARVRNIIATVEGESGEAVLLSAHYDSVPAGPGASDAMSAVATLLEVARLLKREQPPRNSVVFLFNEGEENGLLGARAFMDNHSLASTLRLALNIEARGSTGQSVMFETGADSGWLVEHYADRSPALATSSVLFEAYQALPNDTDMTVFKQHGLQGLNFAHAEKLVHYHTPLDNLGTLTPGSLQHHGDNVWGVLSQVMNADLASAPKGNRVYADLFGVALLSWHESQNVWLLSGTGLAVLSLIAVGVRSRTIRPGGLLTALGGHLAIVLASGLAVWGASSALQVTSGLQAPWTASLLPVRWFGWLTALLAVVLVARFVSPWLRPLEALASFAFGHLVLAVICSVYAPGVVVLFLPSAVIGVVAGTFVFFLVEKNAQEPRTLGTVILAISALSASTLFLSMAFVLEGMVSYRMAPAIGIMLGFAGTAWLAVFIQLRSALGAPLVGVIASVSVACFLWSWLSSGYSASHPQHITLRWVEQQSDAAALLVSSPEASLPERFVDVLPAVPVRDRVFPWSPFKYRHSQFEPASQTVEPLVMQIDGEPGHWRLNWRTDPQSLREVRLYVPVASGLRRIRQDDQTIDYQGERPGQSEFFEYRCIGQSCADQDLQLELSPRWRGQVIAVSVYQGLPERAARARDARDRFGVPVHSGDQAYYLWAYSL